MYVGKCIIMDFSMIRIVTLNIVDFSTVELDFPVICKREKNLFLKFKCSHCLKIITSRYPNT